MSVAMPTSSTPSRATSCTTHADKSPSEAHPLFTSAELREFAADDIQAGRIIGKLLSALFIYTIIATSIAVWWSLSVIGDK